MNPEVHEDRPTTKQIVGSVDELYLFPRLGGFLSGYTELSLAVKERLGFDAEKLPARP